MWSIIFKGARKSGPGRRWTSWKGTFKKTNIFSVVGGQSIVFVYFKLQFGEIRYDSRGFQSFSHVISCCFSSNWTSERIERYSLTWAKRKKVCAFVCNLCTNQALGPI